MSGQGQDRPNPRRVTILVADTRITRNLEADRGKVGAERQDLKGLGEPILARARVAYRAGRYSEERRADPVAS